MGKRTDTLIMRAIRAISKAKNGAFKTRYNHIQDKKHFVKAVRSAGYGVKKWENITNKHVAAAVKVWKDRDLATATIKNYLSGVREVCRLYGNDKIHEKNSEFGLENRVYITNTDKAMPQEVYERVVHELKAGEDTINHRIAAQLMLERELGLRVEEATKFNPAKSVLKDGRILVQYGTKGGRERIIHEISDKAKQAVEYTEQVVKRGNLIPKDMSEKQWMGKYYRTIRAYGVSKENCGASGHGCRHAYAQERYERLTGFKSPCKFDSKSDFRRNAQKIAGNGWLKLDNDARQIIKGEMGHGPDRDDVVSQYLGSI